MAKRVSHRESLCGVARPLDAIGDWWSLLIVRDAFDGLRRFGEFQKNLGLAKNILADRLRNLVAHGVLEAVPASDGSPYQEYVLTAKGRGLFPVLVALRQWGEEFFFEPGEAHASLVDRQTAQPVRRLELRAQDGRLLGPEDTVVRVPNPSPLAGEGSPAMPDPALAGEAHGGMRGRNTLLAPPGPVSQGNSARPRRAP